jgi:uncharacterized protein (DUF2252 family)
MTDQLIARIETFNRNRLPEMLHFKFEGMAENMFRFYRGTSHLFYEPISKEPLIKDCPKAWICGDLHLENFGTFRSDNRLVYFDLNDYDEAVLAPVTWEVARLLTSIFVAFESLDITEKKAFKMASLFLKSYTCTLARGKSITIETRNANGIVGDFLSSVSKRKQHVLLKKRTTKRNNRLEILMDHQKHFALDKERRDKIFDHVTEWLKNDDRSPYNYKVIDAVFRMAGTGSLGLNRYVILMKSLNQTGEKYILIDMKQASPSSVLPYLETEQPAWRSEAERVITVQESMQDRCPALLSTSEFEGNSYIMQEMQPEEDNINFKLLGDRYRDMYTVIDNMAMLTGSSQLRSSGQRGSAITDELKEWAQNVKWQDAVLDYAHSYSKTVQADYKYYCAQYFSHVIH